MLEIWIGPDRALLKKWKLRSRFREFQKQLDIQVLGVVSKKAQSLPSRICTQERSTTLSALSLKGGEDVQLPNAVCAPVSF